MRGAVCCLSVIVSSWEAQTCVHAKATFRQPAIEFLRKPSGPQRRGTELGCGKVHASVGKIAYGRRGRLRDGEM
jgi:hypothetical protein